MTREEQFLLALETAGRPRGQKGIGTLGEKTVHAVLKYYLEPREEFHEIKTAGYVADICSEQGITEIQTRNFNALRDKLGAFLEKYPVTLAYPIPHIKWLRWIDEETGEVTKRRKSPKKGTPYEVFYELYKIKPYLTHPNLRLRLILMDMEEYRLLNGWSRDKKRGSCRYDRIPVKLVQELELAGVSEYGKLIPPDLKEGFTVKDYGAASGLSPLAAGRALNVLNYVGAVARCGKKGRAYCYKTAGEEMESWNRGCSKG